MLIDPTEGLGLVAGFVGSFAFAPQAVRIIRTGHAADVSALTYSMVFGGAVLWTLYGISRAAPAIILWNVVAALLAAIVLALKFQSGGASKDA